MNLEGRFALKRPQRFFICLLDQRTLHFISHNALIYANLVHNSKLFRSLQKLLLFILSHRVAV